ncbi:hypothetical protein TcasGA2_TC031387 [Tribolium castaneum]|uniref:Uncharacterized protein n=1 Tax=Tribolium castaneum TaxID=7070 RepID=A0A139WAB3_TRICA|nr:hypothetical protein TcasGA2_TC031387 [Tribolium castaneum]
MSPAAPSKRLKEATVPEEVLNGLSMHSSPPKVLTGGSASDAPNDDLISVKAAVGEQEDENIEEYLQRSDTAVIYPEPVGQSSENRAGPDWTQEKYRLIVAVGNDHLAADLILFVDSWTSSRCCGPNRTYWTKVRAGD